MQAQFEFFWSRWVKIWVTMLSLFWIREVLWGKLTTFTYLYASVKVTEVPSFRNMRVVLSAIEEYNSAASKKRSKKLTMERLDTTCAYTARSWWPTEEYIRSVPFCRYALECGEHLSLQVTFSYDFVIFELNKTGPRKQPLISTLDQDEPSQ